MIKRRPAYTHQLCILSGRNLARRAADGAAAPGSVSLCLGDPLADPLDGQFALHLGHGLKISNHKLKHIIMVPGIKAFFDEVDGDIFIFKLMDNKTQVIDVAAQAGDTFHVDVIICFCFQAKFFKLQLVRSAAGQLIAILFVDLVAFKSFLLAMKILFLGTHYSIGKIQGLHLPSACCRNCNSVKLKLQQFVYTLIKTKSPKIGVSISGKCTLISFKLNYILIYSPVSLWGRGDNTTLIR